MKGIVITTDNTMRVEEYSRPLYESVGKTVGGHIEMVRPKRLPHPYCMVGNEEGLLRSLPLNPYGCELYGTREHGNPIVGDIVLLKVGFVNGEHDIVGLDDNDIYILGAMAAAISGNRVKWEGEVE